MDYSNIVVIFGNITGIDETVGLSENQSYSFSPPSLELDPDQR